MTVESVRRLFSYTEWANARMIECIRGLSAEQFTRRVESSFPTVRDTLAHLVMAEWVWLRRWKGESPTALPAWTSEPTIDIIESELRAVEEERGQYTGALTGEDLEQAISCRTIAGELHVQPLGDLMSHLVNHSTYHRGQLTTMLRQLGATPPSTDLIVFLRQQVT